MLSENEFLVNVTGKNSRTHQISQASKSKQSVDLLKKKENSILSKWQAQKKSNCLQEQRGLGYNEGMKYSSFSGGVTGVPRWVLTNHSFLLEGRIPLSLLGSYRNCHGNTGAGDFSLPAMPIVL